VNRNIDVKLIELGGAFDELVSAINDVENDDTPDELTIALTDVVAQIIDLDAMSRDEMRIKERVIACYDDWGISDIAASVRASLLRDALRHLDLGRLS
jgi:hypothetical protein